jgi:hypothetical protein
MSERFGFPGYPGGDERVRPVHPDELAGDPMSAAELAGALEAARTLETVARDTHGRPSPDFADRVMARLEGEPAPGPAGYLVPLRRSGLRGLAASICQAWWFVERGSRPLAARATALAYILAVVIIGTSLTGLVAYGAAGALGAFDQHSPVPTDVLESPAPISEPPSTPQVTPSPPPSVEPTEDPSPSELESEDPKGSGGGSGPTATPRETEDDHGDRETPTPTGTPEPTETPHDD